MGKTEKHKTVSVSYGTTSGNLIICYWINWGEFGDKRLEKIMVEILQILIFLKNLISKLKIRNSRFKNLHGDRFDPWVRKIPWRRKWQAAPVFLPGESHGQRRLVDYSSTWGRKTRTQLSE